MAKKSNTPAEDLVWIEEPGDNDAATVRVNRRKVRQQAMRHVVATTEKKERKRPSTFKFVEGYRKAVVEEQSKADAEAADDATEAPEPSEKRSTRRARGSSRRWVFREVDPGSRVRPSSPIKISETGYNAARIKFDFDILNLSTFTGVIMGRASATALHHSEREKRNWLRFKEASFLNHIPELYTTSPLLSTIVDSVLARAQRLICPDPKMSESAVYALYGKALRDLQGALIDRTRALDSDVLCSVQVMQLFEVLDFSQPEFWARHTAGITRLVKMRGPHAYKTALERDLLVSSLGTIFGEYLLQHRACFFAEEAWQATLQETILAEPSAFRRTTLGIWKVAVNMPGLIRQTSDVLFSEGGDREAARLVVNNWRQLRSLSMRWRMEAFAFHDVPEEEEYLMLEAITIAYGGDIIATQAIVCLAPLDAEAMQYQDELTDMVARVKIIAERLRTEFPGREAMIARVMHVIGVAEASHEDLQLAIDGHPDYVDYNSEHVQPEVWDRISGLMGRKVLTNTINRGHLLHEISEMGSWLSYSLSQCNEFLDGRYYPVSPYGTSPSQARRLPA